jgi:hypothetical protein
VARDRAVTVGRRDSSGRGLRLRVEGNSEEPSWGCACGRLGSEAGRLLGFPRVGWAIGLAGYFMIFFMELVPRGFGPRPGLQPGQPGAQIRPWVIR